MFTNFFFCNNFFNKPQHEFQKAKTYLKKLMCTLVNLEKVDFSAFLWLTFVLSVKIFSNGVISLFNLYLIYTQGERIIAVIATFRIRRDR